MLMLAATLTVFCAARADEIHDAVQDGDIEQIVQLLTDNPEVIKSANEDGQTPLHLAAEGGDLKMMTLLIKFGGDVNARDSDGATPLHVAVDSGNNEAVKALVAKGADLNAKNNDGQTPLDIAHDLQQRAKEIVEMLTKQPDKK